MANPRLQQSAPPTAEPYNPLASRAVDGLDAGRHLARRGQRRRRRFNRVLSLFVATIVIGAVAAVGWFGYQYFQEQQTDDLLEQEQNRAETVDRTGDNLRDALNQLETEPRWNGPGNPIFGVGESDGGNEVAPGSDIVITTSP